jgi:hypothetical protein
MRLNKDGRARAVIALLNCERFTFPAADAYDGKGDTEVLDEPFAGQ